jgi:hypothetical protein
LGKDEEIGDDRKSMNDFRNGVRDYAETYHIDNYEIDDKPYDIKNEWDPNGYWPNYANIFLHIIDICY